MPDQTDVLVPIFQVTLPDGSETNISFTPELPEPRAVMARDKEWFDQHPGATYRVRKAYSDELDQPGRWVVVIKHDGPGFRTRLPVKGRARPSDEYAAEAARYYRQQFAGVAREIAKL